MLREPTPSLPLLWRIGVDSRPKAAGKAAAAARTVSCSRPGERRGMARYSSQMKWTPWAERTVAGGLACDESAHDRFRKSRAGRRKVLVGLDPVGDMLDRRQRSRPSLRAARMINGWP